MCHGIKNDILDVKIDKIFYSNLLRFICEYSIQQIKSINKGIHLIENNKIDKINIKPTKMQVELALKWCREYDININNRCIYL